MFGPQKLSLNHWRYRILYWCFGVEKNASPSESGLPSFMFTHYCPLFHATNLIAILSPLILLIKFAVVSICLFFNRVISPILDWLDDYKDNRDNQERHRWKRCKQRLIRDITKYDGEYLHDLKYYANLFNIDEARIIAFVQQVREALIATKQREEQQKKAHYNNMVLLANVGRVIVGWLIYAAYACLAVFSAYLIYIGFWPLIELVRWIFNADYSWVLTALFVGIKILGLLVVLTAVVYGGIKCGVWTKMLDVMPSCSLVQRVVTSPWRCVKNAYRNARDFIAVFYETNCPQIIIVSDDESDINEVLE